MRRIVAQDQAALMALYERFGSKVYGLALRVLRDSRLAEEASQDAFLKVWNKSVQWDPAKGQVGSWLMTIARYAAIDRCVASKGTTQPAPHFWMLYPTNTECNHRRRPPMDRRAAAAPADGRAAG